MIGSIPPRRDNLPERDVNEDLAVSSAPAHEAFREAEVFARVGGGTQAAQPSDSHPAPATIAEPARRVLPDLLAAAREQERACIQQPPRNRPALSTPIRRRPRQADHRLASPSVPTVEVKPKASPIEAVKQIVVFSKNVGKPGVKKELAIGDVMRRKLDDPNFMIPLRIDDIAFGDAPSELIRDQILDGHPNWHDALRDLFETLEEAGVPKNATPDAATLRTIVEAREEGRRFIVDRQEHALSNWFPIKAPPRVRYYRFEGLQEQMNAWLAGCRLPHVHTGRLAGTFADPPSFLDASSFHQTMPTAYDTAFDDFVSGRNLGPYAEKAFGSNDVVNLLRQHFDQLAERRGLLPVDFANGERGWFFPDDLLSANKVAVDLADGRRIRRAMSGKFKRLRWHVCIVAKPRIWPALFTVCMRTWYSVSMAKRLWAARRPMFAAAA